MWHQPLSNHLLDVESSLLSTVFLIPWVCWHLSWFRKSPSQGTDFSTIWVGCTPPRGQTEELGSLERFSPRPKTTSCASHIYINLTQQSSVHRIVCILRCLNHGYWCCGLLESSSWGTESRGRICHGQGQTGALIWAYSPTAGALLCSSCCGDGKSHPRGTRYWAGFCQVLYGQ